MRVQRGYVWILEIASKQVGFKYPTLLIKGVNIHLLNRGGMDCQRETHPLDSLLGGRFGLSNGFSLLNSVKLGAL